MSGYETQKWKRVGVENQMTVINIDIFLMHAYTDMRTSFWTGPHFLPNQADIQVIYILLMGR